MRKTCLSFVVLSLILASIFIPISAYGLPSYSTDAIRHYCTVWNDFYQQYEPLYYCGYSLSDDNKTVDRMNISYNLDYLEMGYQAKSIPSDAGLFFVYDTIYEDFYFCVFSDHMDSTLEKVTIYTDERVITNLDIYCEQDNPDDMWRIRITDDDFLYLYSIDSKTNPITLKLTVDGKNEVIDISRETTPYIFDMVNRLVGVQLYSDTTYENYRSNVYLPGGLLEPTETPEVEQNRRYSFREDYEGIDLAAKSVFYVEKYDKNFECLSSASGFVAFDEHLFVTNQHVIENGTFLRVWDDDNNVYYIDQVVVSDKSLDLAILLFPDGEKYNSLELGGEEELKRGQPVVTIGSPKGLQNTVAYGNISAFPTLDGIKQIQITAPISHGSSGGCLFDDNGKVIGITSSAYEEGQNLNFAIPIEQLQNLYNQWDKTSYEHLGTKRSWDMVGITPTPVATNTPSPTPSPSPKPTAQATTITSTGLNEIVALTENNVEQYFNIELEGVSYEGPVLTLKYDITPKNTAYAKSTQSSKDIIIKYSIGVYDAEESNKPFKQQDFSVIIKKADNYSKTGEIRITNLPELDTVFWDYEISSATGSIRLAADGNANRQIVAGKEYKSITTKQLFYYPQDYKGESIKLSDLQVETWRFKAPSGNYVDVNSSTIVMAKRIKDYGLCLLCYSNDIYVEIILENYLGWDFGNGKDLLTDLSKIGHISIWGEYEGKWNGWGKHYIPTIRLVDDIVWDEKK